MMTIIQSVQLYVALNLLILGLSHFFQPKIWIDFFEFLHSKGHVGNIFNALLSLGTGAFIVSFHFVWEWPFLIVTIYGVLQLLKGGIYLIFPNIGLKSIGNVNKKAVKFKWVGLIMAAVSALIFYHL